MNLKTNKDNSKISFQTNHEKSFLDNIVFEDFSFLNCDTGRVLKEDYSFTLGNDDFGTTIRANTSDEEVSGMVGRRPNLSSHKGNGRIKGSPNGKKLGNHGCIDLVIDFDNKNIKQETKRNGNEKHGKFKDTFELLVGFVAYATDELEAYHVNNNDENKAAIKKKVDAFNALDFHQMKKYIKQGKEMVK